MEGSSAEDVCKHGGYQMDLCLEAARVLPRVHRPDAHPAVRRAFSGSRVTRGAR